ncbi:MAG TPA: hypothetical protein VMU16_13405 [Candidatus Binataceae bacterium]|nr:hypothetical protein [Candidatus Binataceae bacterium]
MNFRHAIVFAIAAISAGGCSTGAFQGPPVPPDKSVVYLYRTHDHIPNEMLMPLVPKFTPPASLPPVICGDSSIRLVPGGYHRFVVNPGEMKCSAHTEVTSSVSISAKPGETYYVKESLNSGFTQVRVNLELVDPADAQADLINCMGQ